MIWLMFQILLSFGYGWLICAAYALGHAIISKERRGDWLTLALVGMVSGITQLCCYIMFAAGLTVPSSVTLVRLAEHAMPFAAGLVLGAKVRRWGMSKAEKRRPCPSAPCPPDDPAGV